MTRVRWVRLVAKLRQLQENPGLVTVEYELGQDEQPVRVQSIITKYGQRMGMVLSTRYWRGTRTVFIACLKSDVST